ncbi:MAG TPA: hypothetical protein VI819_01030 [Patescibacteria group bacterium]|nr:hypothetical protein [Patescibacteria group bacterium]
MTRISTEQAVVSQYTVETSASGSLDLTRPTEDEALKGLKVSNKVVRGVETTNQKGKDSK